MVKSAMRKQEGNVTRPIKGKLKQPRLTRYSLHGIAFLSGAVVLLLEILAARILAPYLGAAFSVWVNIVGTILGSLSLGYYMGGFLADRNQRLLPVLFLVAAVACALVHFETPLLPYFGALGLEWGSLVAATLFFAPASTVLGMVSPYLLRIGADDPMRIGRISGSIFAASTLGSIAGTFVGGFWLIPHFTISHILTGIVLVLLVLSAWSGGAIGLSFVAVTAVLAFAALIEAAAPPPGKWSSYAIHVFEKNSRYYNIRVNDVGGKVRVLLLDGSLQSGRLLDGSGMAFPYTKLSSEIIQSLKPSPVAVLVLGGGGYTIPEAIKSYSPDSKITVVEIDPEVTAVAKRFFLRDPDIPITTLNIDARVFLNRNQAQFDVLYTDVYSAGYSVPPHLATREALHQMRRALKPDGVAVFNIASARAGKAGAVYQSVLRTLREAFPETAEFATSLEDPLKPQNIIVVASNEKPLPEVALRPFATSRCLNDPPPQGLLLTDDYAPTEYLVEDLVRTIYAGQRDLQ